jgi:hypothetical protein
MHLLIPFAAPLSEVGQEAMRSLSLMHLETLLSQLTPTTRLEGDEYALSPPHERVMAQALGWQAADGCFPWATREAAADGLPAGGEQNPRAWGLLSPVHWHMGREHLTMGHPDDLQLDAEESRAYFDAVKDLFRSEGWLIVWRAPTRWYVSHESLADLPTASLDRVIGRNPDLWLPDHPTARTVKRLQSEVQMLLYTHPLNDSREASGRPTLNSLWLSGCGRPQPERGAVPFALDTLAAPSLREDWEAWIEGWRAIDAGPLRDALGRLQRGEPLTLTLCGERNAQTFEARKKGYLAALRSRWQRVPATGVLAAL